MTRTVRALTALAVFMAGLLSMYLADRADWATRVGTLFVLFGVMGALFVLFPSRWRPAERTRRNKRGGDAPL